VLEEGDADEPVVDPKVRDEVVGGDLSEGSVVGPGSESNEEESDSDVGRDDLSSVSLVEHGSVGVEVVGKLGVRLLSRSVPDQVHRLQEEKREKKEEGRQRRGLEIFESPLDANLLTHLGNRKEIDTKTEKGEERGRTEIRKTSRRKTTRTRREKRANEPEKLLEQEVDEDEERSVSDSLSQLELSLLGDVETLDVLLGLVEFGVVQLIPGSGNEDLVSSDVTGSSVVSTVRDPPGVVRNSESRVNDPSDRVVDGLKEEERDEEFVRRVSRVIGEREFAPSKSRRPGLFPEKIGSRTKELRVSTCGSSPRGNGRGRGGEEKRNEGRGNATHDHTRER